MRLSLTPQARNETQRAIDDRLEKWGSTHLASYDARCDTRRYSVTVSRDPIQAVGGMPDPRWHISVAGERDVPRWADLVAIAHEVRPGVCFAVGIPPRSHWMSLHPHCLHLYEVHDDNLTAQWMAERMGVAPS